MSRRLVSYPGWMLHKVYGAMFFIARCTNKCASRMILSWHEDVETAYGLAKEAKTRIKEIRRRRGRRGGRRNKVKTESPSAESQAEKASPEHIIAPKGERPLKNLTTYEREVFLAEKRAAERQQQSDPAYKPQTSVPNEAKKANIRAASQTKRPKPVIAPKGEWPFKDALMIVRHERRRPNPKG
jgi:hypothetical protein